MDKQGSKVVKLAELRWQQFRELVPAEYDAVVIAIGTIEAHGAIPLGTDIFIPEYLAARLAEQLDIVLAPTVNYGVTRTMLPYPGSHTVTSATFTAYMSEIFEGFGRMGFRRLVVMNGHGGHLDELKQAAQAAYRATGIFTVVLHWWLMAPEAGQEVYGGEGYHGAAEETAGVMVAAPHLVDKTALAPLKSASYAPGVYYLPFPRPVSAKETGGAMPDGDESKARSYMALIERKCLATVRDAFAGWREELKR